MAPEYSMHGHLSKAVDVFSFGVLVLELISGHRNYSFNLDVDAENLLDWVRSQSPTVLFISDYCSTGKKKSICLKGDHHSPNRKYVSIELVERSLR